MKKLILVALLSVFVVSACTGPEESEEMSGSSEGVEDFSIDGTWSAGDNQRIHTNEGVTKNISSTLNILETDGRTFTAKMTWTTPEGEMSTDLVGAMSPDGRLISGAKEEGVFTFSPVDEDAMDFCYTETGEGEYLVACGQYTRDD